MRDQEGQHARHGPWPHRTHIKPLLGSRKVIDLTRADVRRFLQDVAAGKTTVDEKTKKHGRAIVTGGKGTATRTVGLLGGILAFAVERGTAVENVARGVKRFTDRKNQRFLSAEELTRLGGAFRALDEIGQGQQAFDIIKLLVFTGARKGEIEQLKWDEVDFKGGLLRLADSKTGQKALLLNAPALAVLTGVERDAASPFVFPASRGAGYFEGLPKVWRRIRVLAGLEGVRLHDLRHSFASVAVSGGASLPIIGALLGHSDSATTQRYAHLSNDPVRAVSDKAGQVIEGALNRGAEDVMLRLVR